MFDRRKKVSIDFFEPFYRLMTTVAQNQRISNSAVINTLIDIFLQLPPHVAHNIGTFCRNEYYSEKIAAASLTGLAQQDKLLDAEYYRRVSEYFGADEATPESKMRRIYLADGYAIFPADWIVLPDIIAPPEQCMYAGVVECRNAEKYQIPHFVFFSNYRCGADYPDDFVDAVYAKCAAVYPDFRRYYNMQQPLPDPDRTDDEGQKLMRAWMEAPEFGVFHFVEKGAFPYWNQYCPDYDPPYGAMIVRDPK